VYHPLAGVKGTKSPLINPDRKITAAATKKSSPDNNMRRKRFSLLIFVQYGHIVRNSKKRIFKAVNLEFQTNISQTT
jgi:hypothetical protein